MQCPFRFLFSSRISAYCLTIVDCPTHKRQDKNPNKMTQNWFWCFVVFISALRHNRQAQRIIHDSRRWKMNTSRTKNEWKKKQYRIGESCQPASQSTCGTEQQQQQLQIKNAERERYRWHRQTIARINNIVWCQFSLKYAGNVLINLTVYCHVIS